MKQINLGKPHTVSASLCVEDVLNSSQENPVVIKFSTDTSESIKAAEANGKEVIFGAIYIAQMIENIITKELFGNGMYPSNEQNFFNNEIMKSSAISFQFKKELIMKILKKKEYLTGKERNGLNQEISSLNKARNALAHGKIRFDMSKGTILEYYSGNRKEDVLDDAYWSAIEYSYGAVTSLLEKARKSQERLWIEQNPNWMNESPRS